MPCLGLKLNLENWLVAIFAAVKAAQNGCHFYARKSLEEQQSAVENMDEEEKGLEMAMAKSLVEIQKLEAQKQSQQQLLAEHFKNTMAVSDATFGKGMMCPLSSSTRWVQ